ncbi:MAG: tRNA uridine-5-carboxymethylaminomethyl(34) synthesis GTPase MnmE, partial [Lautropia sp.]
MQDKRPICAIATAPGQGAIGVVRVSAPEPDIITALAADILGPERRLVARKAAYGPFLAADAQPIDYGLALWFPAPHSYTGEHILELQGHGGPVVQQILLRRVLQVGAAFGIRLAEPGEFTERAFLNDKLDLVQAEAVADLIEASTEQAARSATRSLQGVFSRQIDDLAEQLLTLRMLVEATLDFPEEEIDFLQKADAAGRLARIDDTLRRLFDTAQSGARLRQGLNVVLTGAPNVGKSSLLNALAGAEVAIVTPIAGTTRDRVIEQISIEGVPINLIDTAGLRDTDDPVEKIGIQRTWAEIEKADVVVHLRAADELAREDGNQIPGETGQGNGKKAVPEIIPDAGTGSSPEQRPGQGQTGSAPLDISRLEAAIEARVP